MLKNIKQKITKKNIGFLLTAVIVLLGSGVFVIYAQTTNDCSDLKHSCLSETLLRVVGKSYIAKDLIVNAGGVSGKLSVFDNGQTEKFTVTSDGKITSPTISDVSGSNPTCKSGYSLAKKWNAQSWTIATNPCSVPYWCEGVNMPYIKPYPVSCGVGGWTMAKSGTPTCSLGSFPSPSVTVPAGCVATQYSYDCTDTGCSLGNTITCSAQSWNRAICVGD